MPMEVHHVVQIPRTAPFGECTSLFSQKLDDGIRGLADRA
jgi:hypothetical protein